MAASYSAPTLELTLISAKDLHDVNLVTKMAVYAVADIDAGAASKPSPPQRTPTHVNAGKNPSWNSTLLFSIPSTSALIRIRLRSDRRLGDRDIGQVHIPLQELIDAAASVPSPKPQFVSYQVRKANSGKPKGVLNISYRFLDAAAAPPPTRDFTPPSVSAPPSSKKDEPVIPYPAAAVPPENSKNGETMAPVSAAAPYYPPPAVYGPPAGHPYYQPQTYNYEHQPAGYGYAPGPSGYPYGGAPPPPGPAVVKPQKKNNFGMGLGTGLIGGAIGGLLIGDMVSDAAGFDF